MAAQRISAESAHADVESGRALLICAYDSEAMCAQNHIGEAMTLDAFRRKEATTPKDKTLIFYCG